MEKIEKTIKQAEKRRLHVILAHGKGLFRESPLPSHDMDHHLRVWHFAKELLSLFENDAEMNSEDFIDGLLVATLFHDMGMVHNTGPDHGKESRELCKDFFQTHPCAPPKDFPRVLQAIEHHDRKEYVNKPGIGDNTLLLLLSLADDLDAYGIIGFFRYSEIYMLREISRGQMPGLMAKNLDQRFGLLRQNIHFAPAFLEKQENRFQQTRKAFGLLESGKLEHLMALFAQECVNEKRSYLDFVQKTNPTALSRDEKETLDQLRVEITTALPG